MFFTKPLILQTLDIENQLNVIDLDWSSNLMHEYAC